MAIALPHKMLAFSVKLALFNPSFNIETSFTLSILFKLSIHTTHFSLLSSQAAKQILQ
jgi:hypothetical protein